MKIRQVGGELFLGDTLTDGQTDMTQLIAAFHNFANAYKSCKKLRLYVCSCRYINSAEA
jgi:hypothetical protein